MDVSTSNILNYSQSVCVTCLVNYCTLAHPYCKSCLSDGFGVAIRQSLICGLGGFGLFATKDFRLLNWNMNVKFYRIWSISVKG